jgi:DNA invertase Pin-like site-specific DNA recombinase
VSAPSARTSTRSWRRWPPAALTRNGCLPTSCRARWEPTGPGLAALFDYARAGDTVVVTAIDRLGRSVAEVTRTIADLGERGILLRALREGIDTATPTGRAVAAIMATLAELELELGRERRAASREARRTRQLPATKPPKLTADRQDQLRRLAATGEPVRELAAAFGIGRATAYRYLSR